ncbi:hypothetical protein, partial [Streptomyces lavendulocolor]|uniref:hypothetical protein n=1 Tax=Streptomyces lavendulocolor TaxID=67316 RepID=UPI00340900AC
MTAAAVVPATAPRLARGAAARRALAVLLFLGGLLALGLLLGGPAHAAETGGTTHRLGGAPGTTVSSSRQVAVSASRLSSPVQRCTE